MRIDGDKKRLLSFTRRAMREEREHGEACAAVQLERKVREALELPRGNYEVKIRDGAVVARAADSGTRFKKVADVEELGDLARACARKE